MKKLSQHDIEKLADVIVDSDLWLKIKSILRSKQSKSETVCDGILCNLSNCKYYKNLSFLELCELDYLRNYGERFICPRAKEQKEVAKEYIIKVLLKELAE